MMVRRFTWRLQAASGNSRLRVVRPFTSSYGPPSLSICNGFFTRRFEAVNERQANDEDDYAEHQSAHHECEFRQDVHVSLSFLLL